MAPNADLSVIARRTPGFSGADLANVINEAALLASRHDKEGVELTDLEEAIERVISGPQRKVKLMSEKERHVISYHECGHTLVAKLLPGADPVHKVSIISRGMALGYTLQLPTDDKHLQSKSDILNTLAILFGGRCAEELQFGEIWTGASDDISKASRYATEMVTRFGMSEKVGPLLLKKPDQEVFLGRGMSDQSVYSERTAQLIDEEVKRLITEAYAKARELLTTNKKTLDDLAAKLFEREVLNAEEIDAILQAARA
jgi:cell division protease FtsH